MNKGYAVGFLIVLLVVVLGFYVAFTGFQSSRDALRARPTSPPATRVVQSSPMPPSPTPTATVLTLPTPIPGITATLTAAVPTAELESPAPPTDSPPPTPTQRNPTPTLPPLPTPTPQVQPPTPTLSTAYQFRLAGPPTTDPSYPSCCYIFGTVRDAADIPLEGVQVQAYNEWNTLPPAVTKAGGEAGQYNIPLGHEAVSWNIVIVDAGGNRVSPLVPVQVDPNVANGYRVDWQRTY